MQRNETTDIFIDYIRHTVDVTDDSESFYTLLSNYLLRPFDHRKTVLARMSEESRKKFTAIWEGHVRQLEALENGLQIAFPINEVKCELILLNLNTELTEMVMPIMDELRKELEKESAQLSSEQVSKIPGMLTTFARAYAFHLLNDAIKLKHGASTQEQDQFIVHQEFHRHVRNALFKDNVCHEFDQSIHEKFQDKMTLVERDLTLYRKMLGIKAIEAFIDGVSANLTLFEVLDFQPIDELLQTIMLRSLQNRIDELRKSLGEISQVKWGKFVDQRAANDKDLFMVVATNDPSKVLYDVKQQALINLCKIASTSQFDTNEVEKNFVQKIITAANNADSRLGTKIQDVLKNSFKRSTNVELRELLGLPKIKKAKLSFLFPKKNVDDADSKKVKKQQATHASDVNITQIPMPTSVLTSAPAVASVNPTLATAMSTPATAPVPVQQTQAATGWVSAISPPATTPAPVQQIPAATAPVTAQQTPAATGWVNAAPHRPAQSHLRTHSAFQPPRTPLVRNAVTNHTNVTTPEKKKFP